jgi:2-keto-4-pentenoate hydratase/2-oxohepta-3-ene-1,7-dioic acid hydratase in catechol pathway
VRLVRYAHDGNVRLGIEEAESGLVRPTDFEDARALAAAGTRPTATGKAVTPDRLLAPIERPGKIFGSGVNFASHLDENPAGVLPQQPGFFSKLPSSVIGPSEPIVIPSPERLVDYEDELAIVIGTTARNVRKEDALGHVLGYTIVHDVSARDLQFAGDMVLGKGLDSFCPMGPAIVTVDELGDASGLELETHVNGERLQHGNTSSWLFDVATLVEFLSRHVTLDPGDVITTGTPAGVGTFRQPQRYLAPGDEVTVSIERIGRLTNPVVAGWKERKVHA